MDANGDATHALFTDEAMMVSPGRSTASTVIPDIEHYPILIEGEPVSSVILIGTVSQSNVRMDHWSFELCDATGMINVSYCNGDYVQVFGKTGMNEYFLQIKAFKIRPIVNYNDTTHHYLYSIYCTLDIRKTNALKAKLKPASSASAVFPKGPTITPIEDIAHGVSLKLIRSALDISQDEIMKVISEQIYLGLIYTTVDDNHFKSSI
uniref:Replication protein A C-terminal domain-containing protein n=1 Tax=Hordeum vulgare subsp. vulgare TaxID=112509 RepID=A0A8I6Y9V1_HORVV